MRLGTDGDWFGDDIGFIRNGELGTPRSVRWTDRGWVVETDLLFYLLFAPEEISKILELIAVTVADEK